jgi:uncharacterized protein YjiS (DUF1127 family)
LTSIFASDGRPRAHRRSIALAALLSRIRRWREHRRSWRQLAAMSDRELQDIGVCRADVAHHYWRDDKGRMTVSGVTPPCS